MYERFISSSMLTGILFWAGVFMNSMCRVGSAEPGLRTWGGFREADPPER
jgi:hypothetical protein